MQVTRVFKEYFEPTSNLVLDFVQSFLHARFGQTDQTLVDRILALVKFQ